MNMDFISHKQRCSKIKNIVGNKIGNLLENMLEWQPEKRKTLQVLDDELVF